MFQIRVIRQELRSQGEAKLQEVRRLGVGMMGQAKMLHQVATMIRATSFQEDQVVQQAIQTHQEMEVHVEVPHQIVMDRAREMILAEMSRHEVVNSQASKSQDEEVRRHELIHHGVEMYRVTTIAEMHQDVNQVTMRGL